MAYKLTPDLLDNAHYDKMKVTRARHVLNHDVSCGIKFMANPKNDDQYLTTAWFIEMVNKWFELMASRHVTMAISKINLEAYSGTIEFLKNFVELFENLQISGKSCKVIWKPIQTGVILTTTSILKLQDKFLNDYGFHYLLTARFTQDCLENLFSVLRLKQVVPTALQFRNNLKLFSVLKMHIKRDELRSRRS